MSERPFTGKTALVTGSAKRLGRAIALALSDEGANLIIHYHRSAAEAEELRHLLLERGCQAWTLSADLENGAELEALLPQALSLAGSLDFLVNSAGVFPRSTLESLTLSDLLAAMRINTWAPFVLCRDFARLVGRGKIVNLLDTRTVGYDWAHVGYITSKHALALLTKMMALDFAPQVTVNAVAPGLILPPPGEDETYLQRLAHTVPLKRHGAPEHVAQAVVFLLKNDFITGQTIFVDGGRHLKEFEDGSHTD